MANQDILQKVITIIGTTFDIDTSHLEASSVAEDVDGWDSVSHAMLVMNLEDEFGLELDIERTMDAATLGALAEMIEAQAAQ